VTRVRVPGFSIFTRPLAARLWLAVLCLGFCTDLLRIRYRFTSRLNLSYSEKSKNPGYKQYKNKQKSFKNKYLFHLFWIFATECSDWQVWETLALKMHSTTRYRSHVYCCYWLWSNVHNPFKYATIYFSATLVLFTFGKLDTVENKRQAIFSYFYDARDSHLWLKCSL